MIDRTHVHGAHPTPRATGRARALRTAALAALALLVAARALATDADDEVRKLAAFRESASLFDSAAAAARRGDADAAHRAFARAIELDPTFVEAMVGLARLALEDGDAAGLDEARAWLERAARARPDYPKVPATQALLAAREGDTARALDAIERAHRLAPDDGEIATNHGALLIERGRLADARKVLEGALRRAPDDALATYNLALVDDLEGRVDRAAWGYGRFLTLSSQADPARAEVRARMQLLLGEVAADAAPAVSSAAPPSADDVAQTPDSENGSRAGAPSPESEGGTRR